MPRIARATADWARPDPELELFIPVPLLLLIKDKLFSTINALAAFVEVGQVWLTIRPPLLVGNRWDGSTLL
jgi:hypothetical protein